ncbi:DUF465 domain-containing protein, partial [Dysosmobacter welbionis]
CPIRFYSLPGPSRKTVLPAAPCSAPSVQSRTCGRGCRRHFGRPVRISPSCNLDCTLYRDNGSGRPRRQW